PSKRVAAVGVSRRRQPRPLAAGGRRESAGPRRHHPRRAGGDGGGARGVGRGDRVAIQLPNVPAFVDYYFAVLRLGGVVVPVNPLLRAAESAFTLEDAEARVLIAWHEAEAPEGGAGAGVESIRIEEPFGGDVLDGIEGADAVVEVDPAETAVIL